MDIAQLVKDNRSLVYLFLALLILGGLGFGGTLYLKQQRAQETATQIFEFNSSLNLAKTKKSWQETSGEFDKLVSELGTDSVQMAFYASELANEFAELGEKEAAKEILEMFKENYLDHLASPHNSLPLFHLVSLYEDLGAPQKALNLLEEMLKRDASLMQDRIYFSLGRIYADLGEKEKSHESFQYVIDHFPSSPFLSYAKAFLLNE